MKMYTLHEGVYHKCIPSISNYHILEANYVQDCVYVIYGLCQSGIYVQYNVIHMYM